MSATAFESRIRAATSGWRRISCQSPSSSGAGLVSGQEERFGSAAVPRVDRQAEADRERGAAGGRRVAHRTAQALGEHVRVSLIGLRDHEGELLAAHAPRAVDPALGGVHRRGHGLKRSVAGPMAVEIVELLEVVEVTHDQAQLAARSLRALELPLARLLEAA